MWQVTAWEMEWPGAGLCNESRKPRRPRSLSRPGGQHLGPSPYPPRPKGPAAASRTRRHLTPPLPATRGLESGPG